jgi:hypothetical protein
MPEPTAIQAFIDHWQASGAAERTNFPQFMVELCDLLDVPRPDPATMAEQAQVVRQALLTVSGPGTPVGQRTICRPVMIFKQTQKVEPGGP